MEGLTDVSKLTLFLTDLHVGVGRVQYLTQHQILLEIPGFLHFRPSFEVPHEDLLKMEQVLGDDPAIEHPVLEAEQFWLDGVIAECHGDASLVQDEAGLERGFLLPPCQLAQQ